MRVPTVLVVGDLVADLRVRPEVDPEPGGEAPGTVTLHGGGSAANQAAWLARLGARVRFAGRVGVDPLGDWLVQDLAGAGVEVLAARDPARPTGVVLAWIHPDGERTLVTSRQANAVLDPADVPDGAWEGADLLLLSGYLLTLPGLADVARALIATARARGLPFAVDAASGELIARHPGPGRFRTWTAGAAWCLANARAARVLTGRDDPEAAARELLTSAAGAVVTAGARGCALAWREGDRTAAAHVPAEPVARVLDTTGAGDAFAAGFLHAWLGGAGPVAAARLGHRLAAQALAVPGGRPPAG